MQEVYLKEIESGALVLVDSNGNLLGRQNRVVISQSIDSVSEVTVTFVLSVKEQIYKGEVCEPES